MQHDAVFAVVIPTLNEEKLLPGLLDTFSSELKKKHRIKIVVSDGGSTDKTLAIAENKADMIISSNCKQNISFGRNAGANALNADVFVFLNADCIIPDIDGFFNRCTNLLMHHDALAFRIKIHPAEEIISDKIVHNCFGIYQNFLSSVNAGFGRGECNVIKAEVFKNAGGYNENFAAGEDFDFYRRIRKIGYKVKYSDFTIYESPRRYRKLGYVNVLSHWSLNALSILIRNKPVSRKWKPVR